MNRFILATLLLAACSSCTSTSRDFLTSEGASPRVRIVSTEEATIRAQLLWQHIKLHYLRWKLERVRTSSRS